jgi:hypothetical protein
MVVLKSLVPLKIRQCVGWNKKNEMLADFGSSESYRTGALNIFNIGDEQGFKLLIPWSTTGNNPCEECQTLDGELSVFNIFFLYHVLCQNQNQKKQYCLSHNVP